MEFGELNEKIRNHALTINALKSEISKVIVGQEEMVEALIMGIIGEGHILLEGVPGLAKTTAVKAFADSTDLDFQRIQFTPDLLPADIIGSRIFNMTDHNFEIKKGVVFSNVILADEINRAPAKVQSALLEAMQERQVTIGGTTFALPEPFIVLATQNPLEQEGTYPLPEAQVDRFMFKVLIDYPTPEEELKIIEKFERRELTQKLNKILNKDVIKEWQEIAKQIYSLNEGEVSQPFVMMDQSKNKEVCAIVRVKKKMDIHRANLADDFQAIKSMLEQKKGAELIHDWILQKQKNTYVQIAPGWQDCEFEYPNWLH